MIKWDNSDYLMHYGIKGRSGRYPAGSGEHPKTGPRANRKLATLQTKKEKNQKKIDKFYSRPKLPNGMPLTEFGVAKEKRLLRKERKLDAKIRKIEKSQKAEESEITAHALGYKIHKDPNTGSVYASAVAELKNGEMGNVTIRSQNDKHPSSELLKSADKEITQKLDSWESQARNTVTGIRNKKNLDFEECEVTSDNTGKKIEKTEFIYFNNEDDSFSSVEYSHKRKKWSSFKWDDAD